MTLPSLPTFQTQVGFSNNPLDASSSIVWTDVSAAMRGFDTSAGRQHELDRPEAGTLDMTLRDTDGRVTPGNTMSPYYNLLASVDSTFGTGNNWVATAGSVAVSSVGALYGTTAASVLIPAASVAQINVSSVGAASVVVGATYSAAAYFKANSSGASVQSGLLWLNASGASVSLTTGASVADTSTGWTQCPQVNGAAPANAASVVPVAKITGAPNSVHFVDCAMECLNNSPTGPVTIGWTLGQSQGLVPAKPVRILGSWSGSTFPVFYGFTESWTPTVNDELNQDCELKASDVLSLLSLAPISNSTLYPATINAASPVAYYRCGDPIGTTLAADASGNGRAASVTYSTQAGADLIAFGAQDLTGSGLAALLGSSFTGNGSGAVLYDPTTAVTCPPLGGNSIQTPSLFGGASAWTFLALIGGQSCAGANVLLTNNGVTQLQAFIDPTTGKLQVSPNNAAGFTTGGPNLSDGKWHLLAIACPAGSGTLNVYVDGSLAFTVSQTAANNPTHFAEFGQGTTVGSVAATLTYQDVAFFGTQLSAASVGAIYNVSHYLQDVEFTGQRINKVLTIIGYGSYAASIATGTQLCQGETLSQVQTASLDYILKCADTELGFFYQGDDGTLNFRDANWPTSNPTSATPQAVFGNLPVLPPGTPASVAPTVTGSAGTTLTSGTFTPTAGESLIVSVEMSSASLFALSISDSWGLTWTQIASTPVQGGTADFNGSALFISSQVPSSPGPGHVTVTSTRTIANAIAEWYATTGAGAISATGTGGPASVSPGAVTLSASPASTSLVIGAIGLFSSGGGNAAFTPPSGWTDLGTQNHSTVSLVTSYINGSATQSASWGWSGTSGSIMFSAAVAEITGLVPLRYLANGFKIPQDALDYWTDVQIQAQQAVGAGSMQEVSSAAAVAAGGRRVLQRTGLLFATDSQALAQANLLLSRYSTPMKRVQSMTIGAESGSGNVVQMLQRALWDQLAVVRQGPGESVFQQDSLIEAKGHSFRADPGTYRVTFALSPYELIA